MEPIHYQRHMESQISQNYDPAFVPSMPSSVSANTSVHWQQYSGQNRGFTAPLDEAPNVVGIGYDAQTVEREMAQDTFKNPHSPPPMNQKPSNAGEEKQPAEPSTPTVVPGEKGEQSVNPANATHPAYKNVGKPTPDTSVPVRAIR